jgi:hypothetical protein
MVAGEVQRATDEKAKVGMDFKQSWLKSSFAKETDSYFRPNPPQTTGYEPWTFFLLSFSQDIRSGS